MSLLNPFGLLGLDYSASREEVRLAFKELALICHPDKGGDIEQMRVLYLCYRYVLEQVEYGDHGRTMEDEEREFRLFIDGQRDGLIPSIFEIMTDDSNRRFNEIFEVESGERSMMCYPSNYMEKMEREPDIFSVDLVEYKEPVSSVELGFNSLMRLKLDNLSDFSDYSGIGYDYILAHSMGCFVGDIKEERDVMLEYELQRRERGI